MQIDRRLLVASDHAQKSPRRQQDVLSPWLPWIIAPLFTLLPIVGCWLANSFQQPRTMNLRQPTVTAPSPSTETVVTFAQPNNGF
ncbi:MAG: hypothetical protein ISQ10_08495 [Planctomycetes bacterium]|nr:hypothetical protein [Planctomycetota bacterium]